MCRSLGMEFKPFIENNIIDDDRCNKIYLNSCIHITLVDIKNIPMTDIFKPFKCDLIWYYQNYAVLHFS